MSKSVGQIGQNILVQIHQPNRSEYIFQIRRLNRSEYTCLNPSSKSVWINLSKSIGQIGLNILVQIRRTNRPEHTCPNPPKFECCHFLSENKRMMILLKIFLNYDSTTSNWIGCFLIKLSIGKLIDSVDVLEKDKSFTIHKRNFRALVVEMYKMVRTKALKFIARRNETPYAPWGFQT